MIVVYMGVIYSTIVTQMCGTAKHKFTLVKVVLVKSCDSAPPQLPAGFEISIFKVGLVQSSSSI